MRFVRDELKTSTSKQACVVFPFVYVSDVCYAWLVGRLMFVDCGSRVAGSGKIAQKHSLVKKKVVILKVFKKGGGK